MSEQVSPAHPAPALRRLEGRSAVITGGGSGIGLATARRLAAEGAHVVVGDVDPVAGKAAAHEVGGLFVPVDVTNEEEVRRLYEVTRETYGRVDIAFNNAGISPPEDASILETGIDAWRRVQEVNLTSVYYCCKYALPHMLAAGKGSIINTASFVAVMGAATSQISYSASKGGVLAMSRELGVEFARRGGTRERPVPRTGEHSPAAGTLCQGPGASRPPAGAHTAGPVRRAGGTRRGCGLPGQR